MPLCLSPLGLSQAIRNLLSCPSSLPEALEMRPGLSFNEANLDGSAGGNLVIPMHLKREKRTHPLHRGHKERERLAFCPL